MSDGVKIDEVEKWLASISELHVVETASLVGFLIRYPEKDADEIDFGNLIKEENTFECNELLNKKLSSVLKAFCQWRKTHNGGITARGVAGFAATFATAVLPVATGVSVAILCLLIELGADKMCPYAEVYEASGTGSYVQEPPDSSYTSMEPTYAKVSLEYHPGILTKRTHPHHPATEHQLQLIRKGHVRATVYFQTEHTLDHFSAILKDGTLHTVSFVSGSGEEYSFIRLAGMQGMDCRADQIDALTLQITSGSCDGLTIDGNAVRPVTL